MRSDEKNKKDTKLFANGLSLEQALKKAMFKSYVKPKTKKFKIKDGYIKRKQE